MTKEQFFKLLGALPDNALVSQIYDTLEYNGYEIKSKISEEARKRAAHTMSLKDVGEKTFQDFTNKGQDNLTGHTKVIS